MAKSGGTQQTTTAPAGPAATYYGSVMAQGANPDYTAVNTALNGADNQMWQNFYNTQLPQINQKASFLGNQSAGIKDLNSAVSQIGQAQSSMGQEAYLGAYNQARQNALTAARGLGGTTAETMTPGSGANLATLLGGGLAGSALLSSLLGSGGGSNGSGGSINSLLGAGKSLYNYLGGGNGGTFYSGPQASDAFNPAYTYDPSTSSFITDPGMSDVNDLGLEDFSSAGGQAAATGADAGATAGYGGEMAGGEFGIPLGAGDATVEAADAGLEAGTTADIDALGYEGMAGADAGASGAGAASAGTGALGSAALVAAPLAVAAYGASQAPYTLSQGYWNGVNANLTNGNNGQIGGINGGAPQAGFNQTTAQAGLLADALNTSDKSDIGGANGMNIPASTIANYPGGAAKFYSDLAQLQQAMKVPTYVGNQAPSLSSRAFINQQ